MIVPKGSERMQCGCPVCGTFMGQVEKGASSRCVCPGCGFECDACLGTDSAMKKGSYSMPDSFAREIERENEQRRAMDAALRYLTDADRTRSRMESNLLKKGFSKDVVELTLEKLKSYGYVDDEDYAKRLVKQEVGNKGLGKRSVAGKLYRSGIDRETADAALCAIDDETEKANALAWTRKLAAKVDEPDPRKKRDKLVRRLALKGFSYDTINYALRKAMDNEDECD